MQTAPIHEPFVDLVFPVTPACIPIDHGYRLYAAISSRVPSLHRADWLAIHPLWGSRLSPTEIMLTQDSRLRLRLPATRIPEVLSLTGQELRIDGSRFRVGAPSVVCLSPCSNLVSSVVCFHFTRGQAQTDRRKFRERFVDLAKRGLATLSIEALPKVGYSRSVSVRDQRSWGYHVEIDGLTPEQSLMLQTHGIGGKRRMGCGIFRATHG